MLDDQLFLNPDLIRVDATMMVGIARRRWVYVEDGVRTEPDSLEEILFRSAIWPPGSSPPQLPVPETASQGIGVPRVPALSET
jgi:hypothetical protein